MKKTIATMITAVSIAAIISARPNDPPVVVHAAPDPSMAAADEIVTTAICETGGIFCRGDFVFSTAAALEQLPDGLRLEFDKYRGGFVATREAVVTAVWRDL